MEARREWEAMTTSHTFMMGRLECCSFLWASYILSMYSGNQNLAMAHFLRFLCNRVWLGLCAPEEPVGLEEMPEAAKVAFVAMSLEFVEVIILLLVTSGSITVFLLVTVEARLSMLLPSIYMKVTNWGRIVVYLAPAGRLVEW